MLKNQFIKIYKNIDGSMYSNSPFINILLNIPLHLWADKGIHPQKIIKIYLNYVKSNL